MTYIRTSVLSAFLPGHAGAVISGGKGDAKSKMAVLTAAGATISKSPSMLGTTMLQVMKAAGLH